MCYFIFCIIGTDQSKFDIGYFEFEKMMTQM